MHLWSQHTLFISPNYTDGMVSLSSKPSAASYTTHLLLEEFPPTQLGICETFEFTAHGTLKVTVP